jgi:hypothetical protein
MGLWKRARDRNMTDPVAGTLWLTEFSVRSSNDASVTCRVGGIVSAPGLEHTAVQHTIRVPADRPPACGQRLPVIVDRADPSRLQVDLAVLATHPVPSDRLTEVINGAFSPAGRAARKPVAGFGVPVATAATTPPPGLPSQEDLQSLLRAAFAPDTPRMPQPGMRGGGLTREQAAQLIASGDGERATALVTAAQQVATPQDADSAGDSADVTLDITCADGTCYRTVTRLFFSTPEEAGALTVGASLNVHIDPADLSRVAVTPAKPS